MNSNENNWNEQRLESLLSSLNQNVPPPDATMLEELRRRSTTVFEAQSQDSSEVPVRRSKMMVLAIRGLATAATAAVVFFSWFLTRPENDDGPQLSAVLAQLAQADTFHLQLVRDSRTTDVWGRKPKQVRWDSPDGTYHVDDGSQVWQVDEEANRATPRPSLLFTGEQAELDLSHLVGLSGKQDYARLLEQRPVDQVTVDGVRCNVYRWAGAGELQVEALVAAQDATLKSLETLAIRDGRQQRVCKLVVAAINQPVDERLFRISDTLTVDGRIGKVLDTQGLVAVRPLNARRWTPLQPGLVLKPGDFLRSDPRGANAVTLWLVKQTRLTLGPGTLVELTSPKQLKVIAGELKIVTDPDDSISLIGPGGQTLKVSGTQTIRLQAGKLSKLAKEPAWVAGFEGATTKEGIGSLVAKIDGRDVPLTVGYHKVSVDIRDQIARTVIEESFVNHTKTQLEGVFYFPLPQEASISGFGMWIGGELVEADVVEKQRAREIYEEILRQKRDPGLLEWTGGNLFKARVFPIPGRSEKRIKITYTQVLPLKGNRYRYAYSLQSELLKQHPLSELAIDVNVSSSLPLSGISSPTHTARISQTKHSARVEFSAQQYTPDRDFEVEIGVDGQQSTAVLISHQRGEDGYFMLQLMPPSESDGDATPVGSSVEREVLPDSGPLELLIVADTSASMREDARIAQADLMSALLSALSPDDSFNLMMCDVATHWLFDEPVPADTENVAAALARLEERISLGWTDLDTAFESVVRRMNERTHVIYVGDGVVTTGDADPIAFSKRLRRLYAGHQGTMHAVAVSSSYEPSVLRTIASLGGGSFRQISGSQAVSKTARELLTEMTQPVTRITKVEFTGLQTARLYPEELPNVPDGTQQILLGRYLPVEGKVEGQVVVSAVRGDEPFQISAPFQLQDVGKGNSFVPRLWARMHLDALLEQGSSQTIKDEVIALSEDYHIITPYTSLLVLESDEDRERFQVKRRVQMRDGERFFAAGRDQVDYQLLQQQMRTAGDWRIRLRMQVLRELATLGRPSRQRHMPMSGGMGGAMQENESLEWFGGVRLIHDFNSAGSVASLPFEPFGDEDRLVYSQNGFEARMDGGFALPKMELGLALAGEILDAEQNFELAFDAVDFQNEFFADQLSLSSGFQRSLASQSEVLYVDGRSNANLFGLPSSIGVRRQDMNGGYGFGGMGGGGGWGEKYGAFGSYGSSKPQSVQWFANLFPDLAAAPTKSAVTEQDSSWPGEARRVADSLLRRELLTTPAQPLEIKREVTYYDARWQEPTSRQSATYMLSSKQWLAKTGGPGAQTLVQLCDSDERSIYGQAFLLGRVRSASDLDLQQCPLDLSGHVLTSLEKTYRSYAAELKPQDDNRIVLVLKHPTTVGFEIHLLIDSEKDVLLQLEQRLLGKVTSTQNFSKFVKVSDAWFATRIENLDAQGRRTGSIVQSFSELEASRLAGRLAELQVGREQVQWIREPLPSILLARKAIEDGKGRFEDHLVMLLQFERIQRWQQVLKQLEAMEKLAADKPGLAWVRDALLKRARQRESLRQRMMDRATVLAEPPSDRLVTEERFLANQLIRQGGGILEVYELLPLLDVLKPVFERQQLADGTAMKQWRQYQVNHLRHNRTVEILALRRQLATDFPHDSSMQFLYASELVRVKEYAAAIAWIDQVVTPAAQWSPHEEESLRGVVTRLYASTGQYLTLAEYLEAWVATGPENVKPYHQYLTALLQSDQIEKAEGVMADWLDAGKDIQHAPPHVLSRVSAAVQLAFGQGASLGVGNTLSTNRVGERWLDPLSEIVLAYLAYDETNADTAASVVSTIMGNYRFTKTNQYQHVRRQVAVVVQQRLAELSFDRLNRLVTWIWNEPTVDSAQWQRIVDHTTDRWESASNADVRHRWGQLLVRILAGKNGIEAHLDFLRRQKDEGPQTRRSEYARLLFATLLQQPWSQAFEDEAAGLITELTDSKDPLERLRARASAVMRLTDSMVQARYRALMSDVKNQSELTRTELREVQNDRLEQARRQYAEHLDSRRRKAPEDLVPWMDVEWCYLQMKLGECEDEVIQRCWEYLGSNPDQLNIDERPEDAPGRMLLYRYITMLANLAARRDAPEGLTDRLLQHLDRMIQVAGEESTPWRNFKYRLFVALDRAPALLELLDGWIQEDDAHAVAWRVARGHLLAEQGRVKEAIACFQPLRDKDLLGPSDLQVLEKWYLVVDQRDKYEQALRAQLEMTGESTLSQWLSGQLRALREYDNGRFDYRAPFSTLSSASAVPGEMDKNVPQVFTVLCAKSSDPQSYLSTLRSIYGYTRDFRLLTGVAESVVGHSAGRVYPFLTRVDDVLDEVREEATCDALLEHLTAVRERAETDVDRRAIDLLELMVERRAAELLDQPGPHAERALAAMRRAFKGEWTAGEPRLMAGLLSNLGRISISELAQEQLRQLESLHAGADSGSADRLDIASLLAGRYWGYSRHDSAIDLLESALSEYQAACEGTLPVSANIPLGRYVGYLERQGHFARGERVLQQQLEHPAHAEQTLWLTRRLYQLYDTALGADGDVSLGNGIELYRELTRRLQRDLDHPDSGHRRELIRQLLNVYKTAHRKTIAIAPAELVAFSRDRLPEVLKGQVNDYQAVVGEVATVLGELAGKREALAMLIRSVLNEPRWFEYTRADGWNQHCWRMGQLRQEVEELGDLQDPLLQIVTRALRRELEAHESRNRAMYWQHHGHFWREQVPAFLRTAETVYARRKNSAASVKYIAEYVARGLDHYGRAIEMLSAAYRDGILDAAGRWQLADYLHHEKRFEESIPILKPLVDEIPENILYRTKLLHAYFRTQRQRELLALLEQTDSYFHEGNRWAEHIISQLGSSCLQNRLFKQSVAYYNEVIPLHKRSHANRGIGQGTLSSYCRSLAGAYAGLGKTAEAVDAACEAIVSWGPRQEQRRNTRYVLEQVLREAEDLDQYVKQLDRDSKEQESDRPIVRKALGLVYFQQRQYDKAAAQLEEAVAMQPNDAETHKKLIECFDKLEKPQAAVGQTLALMQLLPRDIASYQALAQRYQTLGDAANIERTYTSIVEALPNESEGHTMLAEIREQQGRWGDAALHWQQVARIRSLEPTGLLKLAAVQIRLKQWQAAKETLGKLRERRWPSRFGGVESQVHRLEQRLQTRESPSRKANPFD